MRNFRYYGLIILLCIDSSVNALENLEVLFDGQQTICSTTENFPLSIKNITFNQLKDIQQNNQNNEDSFLCNLGDDDLCDSWWLDQSWNRKNSIKSNFRHFISDVRWQGLQHLRLGNLENKNYNFTKLATIERSSFYVPISWKIPADIDLYFCEKESIDNSNCYLLEILIERGKTKLRKCLKSTIPTKRGDKPTGMCSIVLQEQSIKPKLIANEWTGIMIEKSESELSILHVTVNSSKLFSYVPKLGDFLKIKYIFAYLIKGEGIVTVHNYNFLQTSKAGFHQIGRPFSMSLSWRCIFLYVSMCRNCRMMFMMNGNVLADISFSLEGMWQPVKIYIPRTTNDYEQLYVKTIGNELFTEYNYWAIDYVHVCYKRHFIYVPGRERYTCDYVHTFTGFATRVFSTLGLKRHQGFNDAKTNITNFLITSKNKTTIDFRYQLSNNQSIKNFNLQLFCQDLADLEQYDRAQSVVAEKCRSISQFYCGSAYLTGERLNCSLKIFAVGNLEEVSNEDIYFTNSEEAPLEPIDVRISYGNNDKDLLIECKSPIITNGRLKGFEITYTKAELKQKKLNRNIHHSTKTGNTNLIKIRSFSYESCTLYFFQVRAENSYGPGFAFTKLMLTPVNLPNYFKIKKIFERSTSVDFSIRTLPKRITNVDSPKLFHYILVLLTGSKKKCKGLDAMKITNHQGLENITHIAWEFDLNQLPANVDLTFTIGDKTEGKSKYLNCDLENEPLDMGKTHKIVFLAISLCLNMTKKYVYTFNVKTEEKINSAMNISIIFYIVLSIIWFLVGMGSVISFMKYRRRNRPKVVFGMGRRPTTVDNIYSLSDLPRVLQKIPEDDKEELLGSSHHELATFPVSYRKNLDFKKPIKIREFEKYLENGISQDLEEQFLSLPKGLLQPSDEGKQEVNRPKNRFNNIIPYDFNRVKLQNTSESMDYINASFIKGFKSNQTYIAAQGPKSITIKDFWHMIWQENVRYVVMLVNIEESGQKKVEKYWPDHNEDFRFGNLQVFHHSADLLADYEIKVFTITCEGQERKVCHYHFQRWPDHGVPIHFHTLVPFIRKTLEISFKSPVVVHCSSGTASTGVFILCDICLRAAQETGIVDLYKVAYDLRKQRVNMIDNVLQYKLAHLVVMEVLTGLQSVISCNDDIDKFTVKLTSPDELALQMQYLEDTSWHNKVLTVPADPYYPYEVFPKKNKTSNIVPDATEAIQLERYPPSDKSSAYINAVTVDGYHYQDKYVVTQQPMPTTLNDFWRMVVLLDVEIIVSLNEIDLTDDKSCEFWPTHASPQMSPVDFIILNYMSETETDSLKKIVVHAHVKGKEKKIMKVKILSLKGWRAHIVIPDNLHNFLKFHCYVDVIMKQYPKCCVTCYDGNLASGLYVATSYIIEKIKLEKCYSVCEAVKVIRKNRKQFVTNEKQLAYLYEIASTYIKGFETYANFSTSSSPLINIYDYIE